MESSGSAVPELTTYIAKNWSQMLKTQKQATEFLGLSKTRQIGKFSAFFNSRLVSSTISILSGHKQVFC
jgi:hypothetical protein